MEWIASLHKAITYIEEHLMEEINYEDVARQVHKSSYEFHRAFSFLTGMTANTYIRNRRLSLAAKEIVETDSKITDLAFKYGYETPESFTKAFTRFHGVAPRRAREASAKLVLFNPIAIKLTVEGGRSMNYKIVHMEKQKFIAMVKSFSNEIINDAENHDIPDFWDECGDNNITDKMLALRPEGKKDLYGLCLPAKEGEDSFEYGIGVIIDDETASFDADEMMSVGFRTWEVNPTTYVVFNCVGDGADCISATWEKFYKEFLPQMGYETEAETDYEIYYQNGPSDLFCELWIPIKKK